MFVQMKGPGFEIGDVCYSTISYTGTNGKSIVPGSKGRVIGPCNNSSSANLDQLVLVQFDTGLLINIKAKSQISFGVEFGVHTE